MTGLIRAEQLFISYFWVILERKAKCKPFKIVIKIISKEVAKMAKRKKKKKRLSMLDLKPVDFGIGKTNVTEEIDEFAYGHIH